MVNANKIVYTAQTGGKDTPKPNQNFEGAKFVAFVEEGSLPDGWEGWELQPACNLFKDSNRNAKIHKVLPHEYFDCEYSLWIDGTITLIKPIQYLIDTYLKDSDIAMFKHYMRDDVYEEAVAVKLGHLDHTNIIDEQVKKLRREGYPAHNGLNEATIILRRHTPEIQRLNEMWWAEICRYSRRDQLSLNYCMWKLGIKPAQFPLTVYNNLLFDYQKHNYTSELPNIK